MASSSPATITSGPERSVALFLVAKALLSEIKLLFKKEKKKKKKRKTMGEK